MVGMWNRDQLLPAGGGAVEREARANQNQKDPRNSSGEFKKWREFEEISDKKWPFF
jgi:hypothetical protein